MWRGSWDAPYACIELRLRLVLGVSARLSPFRAGAMPSWLRSLRRSRLAVVFRASRYDGRRPGVDECVPVYVNIGMGLWSNRNRIQRIRSMPSVDSTASTGTRTLSTRFFSAPSAALLRSTNPCNMPLSGCSLRPTHEHESGAPAVFSLNSLTA
jgi:hypothetical protein